jgi:hypothetical protein
LVGNGRKRLENDVAIFGTDPYWPGGMVSLEMEPGKVLVVEDVRHQAVLLFAVHRPCIIIVCRGTEVLALAVHRELARQSTEVNLGRFGHEGGMSCLAVIIVVVFVIVDLDVVVRVCPWTLVGR